MSASASIVAPSSGASSDELEAGAVRRRAEHRGGLAGEPAEVDRREARRDAPGLEAREVQQRVDEPQQPQRAAVGDVDPLALGRGIRVGVGERVAERAEHQRQRRAELVRDVGEELGLRAVERGQLLGARVRGGEADRARQRSRQLARDHAEEVAVAVVEPLARAGAEDQRAPPGTVLPGRSTGSSTAWPSSSTRSPATAVSAAPRQRSRCPGRRSRTSRRSARGRPRRSGAAPRTGRPRAPGRAPRSPRARPPARSARRPAPRRARRAPPAAASRARACSSRAPP